MIRYELRPILAEMKELYSQPISNRRFDNYISKLQGNTKGELSLPISGFNPMAKDHILVKINKLQELKAESLMEKTIEEFNSKIEGSNATKNVTVVLNLADDQRGKWTNYYTTDFDSKFKLRAFIDRNFCVPYLYTSEEINKDIIQSRTLEYLCRNYYLQSNPSPKTLEEHLNQEVFVSEYYSQNNLQIDLNQIQNLENFFVKNKDSEEYDIIFNFFYGDRGSESLGYKKHNISQSTGFDYAKTLAAKTKKID